jgi:myo-inositol-1-phosphate synthase
MKCGLLVVGLNGCTANTTIAGANLIVKNGASTLGMLTEAMPLKKLDLLSVKEVIFSGWDYSDVSAFEMAKKYSIIQREDIDTIEDCLKKIRPYPGIFSEADCTDYENLTYIRKGIPSSQMLEEISNDINDFKKRYDLQHIVVIDLSSPRRAPLIEEKYNNGYDLLDAIKNDDINPSSGTLYATASILNNSAYIDFTPNRTIFLSGIQELAHDKEVPIAGTDGNTGQTLLKTALGQVFKARNLKIKGWYSTNILGNNDGLVLSYPEFRKNKIEDKIGCLPPILGYDDFEHVVDISYYLPRGDNKESWDNVDFQGFLNTDMQLKINWLGSDSILAAPLILDLTRLIAFDQKMGARGVQEHLGFFFKNPAGKSARGFYNQYETLIRHYEKYI